MIDRQMTPINLCIIYIAATQVKAFSQGRRYFPQRTKTGALALQSPVDQIKII